MTLVVWGLDEIAESIVLIYAAILGLLTLLVVLEQRLDQPTPPSTRRLRALTHRYLSHNSGYPPELREWLRRTASWDADTLADQLHPRWSSPVRSFAPAATVQTELTDGAQLTFLADEIQACLDRGTASDRQMLYPYGYPPPPDDTGDTP